MTNLQYFINATWYGDYYKADFLTTTGWSTAEYDSFYNVSQENSFGWVLSQVNANNSDHFGCTSVPGESKNCTSEELTLIQWGSSGVTLNPLISNFNYTAPSKTMSDWGQYPVPFVLTAPEYWFWAGKAFGDIVSLNKTQVADAFSTGYSWFGLQNSYNTKMFSSVAYT